MPLSRSWLVPWLALLAAGCGKVRYAPIGDGASLTDLVRWDSGLTSDLTGSDGTAVACQGEGGTGDSVGNDCQSATQKTVESNTTLTPTLYPAGDVDYFRITAKWGTYYPCYGQGRCLKLKISLTSPPGLAYQLTAWQKCDGPGGSSGTSATLRWDEDYKDHSKDAWIKVAPAAGATPPCSTQAYKVDLEIISDDCGGC